MIAAALVATGIGCMAPWSSTMSKSDATHRSATVASTQTAPPPSPIANADPNSDMAGVLDKLVQVRALDPSAEPKLLEELRRTPPNSWPLVAEQFRATLAYHQQLTAKERTPPSNVGSGAEDDLRRIQSDEASLDFPHAASLPPLSADSLIGQERPSTRIGALKDPHNAGVENGASLAQSRPPAIPNGADNKVPPSVVEAPAEFASNGPTHPIDSAGKSLVEPAVFRTPSDITHVATQALASDGPEGSIGSTAPTASNKHIASEKPVGEPDSTAIDPWQQLVQKAANDLSQRVAASPATTAEVHQHVSLRVLRLLSGDTERALEPIPHISPAEQDYWSQQLFALATYLDHHSQPDDKRRAAAAVVHLDEAVSHLRELGSLSLRNLSFCKNVYGYGAIEPYASDIFAPGQQVSLYVEVENYHSESKEKGYCTLLGATYELLDDAGKRVSGGEFPDVDDCCRSRRRDFHIQFGLALPANLAPGQYRLELVVKDRQSDKLGHATAPFEIRGVKK
jgi:hypothetical protein